MRVISILIPPPAGPEYIGRLTDNDVLFINDQIDPQVYINIILKNGVPNCIINNLTTRASFIEATKFYGLPLFVEQWTKKIADGLQFDDNITTLNCFNFMINKKHVNRYLCIKFVEHFKLINFDYTWSAVDSYFDMSDILVELNMLGQQSPLDADTKGFILSPIQLEKKIIKFPGQIESNSCIGNYGGPAWTWRNGLNNLFLNSAISLITESVQHQKASVFTEKTLYPVLGLTFPIWIGGYNQASEWKKIGFDVFDDIIDHSYQSYDTLIERCYYAFANNLELLTNKNKVAELRLANKARLLKNRNLLLQNHLGNYVDQEISKYPPELQSVMPEILKYFR